MTMVCSIFDCSVSEVKICCLHSTCCSCSTDFFLLCSFRCRNPARICWHWRSWGLKGHGLPSVSRCGLGTAAGQQGGGWKSLIDHLVFGGERTTLERTFFISEKIIILLSFSCHSIRYSSRGKGVFLIYTFVLIYNHLGWKKVVTVS